MVSPEEEAGEQGTGDSCFLRFSQAEWTHHASEAGTRVCTL